MTKRYLFTEATYFKIRAVH